MNPTEEGRPRSVQSLPHNEPWFCGSVENSERFPVVFQDRPLLHEAFLPQLVHLDRPHGVIDHTRSNVGRVPKAVGSALQSPSKYPITPTRTRAMPERNTPIATSLTASPRGTVRIMGVSPSSGRRSSPTFRA